MQVMKVSPNNNYIPMSTHSPRPAFGEEMALMPLLTVTNINCVNSSTSHIELGLFKPMRLPYSCYLWNPWLLSCTWVQWLITCAVFKWASLLWCFWDFVMCLKIIIKPWTIDLTVNSFFHIDSIIYHTRSHQIFISRPIGLPCTIQFILYKSCLCLELCNVYVVSASILFLYSSLNYCVLTYLL